MNAILLFVKYPIPGHVKTRLAATLGAERAAEIYRELVERICRALPSPTNLIVMFDPPERRQETVTWLTPFGANMRFVPQCGADLGARLEHAFAHAFARQLKKVAVIGSDCPEITAAILNEAWKALDDHDCAIGPTEDGGYYLLALRKECPALFEGIAWSSDRVFAQTMAQTNVLGRSVHVLPMLQDIDTEDDWRRLERRLPS